MQGPINYNLVDPSAALINGLNIGNALTQNERQAEADAAAKLKAQQAALAQAQMQSDLQSVYGNPNAGHADYARLMTKYPQLAENVGKAFKVWDEGKQKTALEFGSRVYGALQSGNAGLAIELMKQKAKADPTAAAEMNMLSGVAEADPRAAKVMWATTLAGMMGPDKFKEGFTGLMSDMRAEEKHPADVVKTEADATKAVVEARTAAPKAEADIAKTRQDIESSRQTLLQNADRLSLDRDKFNLDFDKTLEEMRAKRLNGGVTLSAGMEKLQADSVGGSLTAKAASDQAARLADLLGKDPQAGGIWTWTANQWREKFGSDSPLLDLRREYVKIRNQGLLADLPPGPASDRDISTMKEGFPSENADAAVLQRWLSAYANVQKAIAVKEEAKADWISAVGALKTSPRDIEVMGTKVPAGTSFVDFIRRGVSPEAGTAKPAAKTGYLQKYGR